MVPPGLTRRLSHRSPSHILLPALRTSPRGETWNAEAIGPLTEALRHDPDEQVRQEAAHALHELGAAPVDPVTTPDVQP
jgi:hypothetical protein